MKEAMFYESLGDKKVRCNLCAFHCLIPNGKKGICQVRENQDGRLYTLVYGRTITQHVDPVEKKPLFHFYPGSTANSIATPGCNFRCCWCQNWEISQAPRRQYLIMGKEASPEQIVAAAKRAGCRTIAYTYTEPTVFFEYSYNTARLAEGLKYVYIGNMPEGSSQDTVCPVCGSLLIRRHSFGILANRVQKGCCPECGEHIAGVGMG